MKKQCLFFSLFVMAVLFSGTVSAQEKFWVGVDLGYNSHKVGDGDALNSFNIAPTLGYHVNDNISIGLGIGFASPAKDVSGFAVGPFVRYGKSVGDKATLFGELGVGIGSTNDKTEIMMNDILSPGTIGRRKAAALPEQPPRLWKSVKPKKAYDAIIVGGGGHGLATAYYLAKNHGITNIAADQGFFYYLPGATKNDFELRSGKSLNVNIGIIKVNASLYKHYINFVTGITYDINNWSYKAPIKWNKLPDVQQVPYQGDYITKDSSDIYRKNKLVTNYLQVPLLLRFETNPTRSKKNIFISGCNFESAICNKCTDGIYQGGECIQSNNNIYNCGKLQRCSMD